MYIAIVSVFVYTCVSNRHRTVHMAHVEASSQYW
nr:MAG TPA: hypothetical protein [Caudoviricetes sp.]